MKQSFLPFFLLLAAACTQIPVEAPHIVPQPGEMSRLEGWAPVAGQAIWVDDALGESSRQVVQAFAGRLEAASGKPSPLVQDRNKAGIRFVFDKALPGEAYTLDAGKGGVAVGASALKGVLYGLASLQQMLPPAVLAGKREKGVSYRIPAVHIQDAPRFTYRGLHLDACRHFWEMDEVKRYIDVMALYKLNTLHLHLNDDQGWRVEINSRPRLTEIGSRRSGSCIEAEYGNSDGIPYGGFYTQEQLRELVSYAADRGITIIPEIDLPGHMLAALAAYPELGCTGGPYEVWTRWGISDEVLCVGKEETFRFLEDVLSEICEIFPSEYIHIGGDECPKVRWQNCPRCQARIRQLGLRDTGHGTKEQYLQNYVTARMQAFLEGKGRKIIGWDEILEGELAPGATVMSWQGTAGGVEASARGFDVVMTPYTYLYLDYYQSHERDKEPYAIGGYLPVEAVYAYEPFDELDAFQQQHILGVQANLWTEYIATPEHLEYMLLPRLCALSEIQWCPRGSKDLDRFKECLHHQFAILSALGYTYCEDVFGQIGLPGSRQPARTPEELEAYLALPSDRDW